jgi:hypothetical protein
MEWVEYSIVGTQPEKGIRSVAALAGSGPRQLITYLPQHPPTGAGQTPQIRR